MSIKKGYKIAILGAFLTLLGDFLLGANPCANTTTGVLMLDMFMDAVNNSEIRMVLGGMLGAIGIPLEGIGYYQIYKLLKSQKGIWPTIYKWAVIAYTGLAGCGVHLACAVLPMLYKWIASTDPILAVDVTQKYANYFMMPPMIIFGVLLFIALFYQAIIFGLEKTIYPRHAALYNMVVGVIVTYIVAMFFDGTIVGNAIGTGTISFGNLWMFIMLLVKYPKEELCH